MASDTLGFAAIGGQTELSSMFQAIMDGLRAQLVAHANVFAGQGSGQAVLTVKLRDGGEPVTKPFTFKSDRDYNAPLPPPTVNAGDLLYQAKDNSYLFNLSVGNPQSVDKLNVDIEETDGGTTVVNDLQINLEGREPPLQTSFSAEDFKAGTKYTIKIQAIDFDGILFEFPGDNSPCSRTNKTILACKEFTYPGQEIQGCEFEIQSHREDYDRRVFVFDLAMPAFCCLLYTSRCV